MRSQWRSGAPRSAWSGTAVGLALALLLLALYLIAPAFSANHVEGYTAALQLNAISANRHLIDRADLLYPVQTEYLYLTRQGVELLLRAAMRLSGRTDDSLFRVLTVGSLGVFLVATARVARRHGGVAWWSTLCALLLLPGLFEIGFYFNDGVVAVAFGTTGFALMPRRSDAGVSARFTIRATLAGVALGCAGLCRADALLMLPLALGLATLDHPRRRELAWLVGLLAAGMLLAFGVAEVLSGTTFLQALAVGHYFDTVHKGARIVFVRVLVFLLFFGLAGLAFVAIGARRLYRHDGRHRRVVLLGLPALVLAYGLHSSTEVRQIYPFVAPFAVLLCAGGLERAVAALAGASPRRGRAVALLVATVVVWVLPPVFVPVKDGPRALFGRVWSPPMWRAWQGRVAASLDDVDALVAEAERHSRLAVITAHFNSEHYLQLRAWQRGWVPLRRTEAPDHCPGGLEVWRKGDHELLQIRLDNPYGISGVDGNDYTALRLKETLPCPALAGTPIFVSDFFPPLSEEPLSRVLREQIPTTPPVLVSFAWPSAVAEGIHGLWSWRNIVVPLVYGVNRSAPVSAEQLRRVAALAEARLADRRGHPGAPLPAHIDDLLPRFRTREWQPPVSSPRALAEPLPVPP